MIRPVFLLSAAVALSACSSTQEMPLAPNVVRMDTSASGLISVSAAPAHAMKRAAEATLRRGYTHFRLEQASTSQGREVIGMTTQVDFLGNLATSPDYAKTSNIGVTVIMFKADEPGAAGAWDAAEVIAKDGRV